MTENVIARPGAFSSPPGKFSNPDLHLNLHAYTCHYCKARPGKRCVIRGTDREANFTHDDRFAAISAVQEYRERLLADGTLLLRLLLEHFEREQP